MSATISALMHQDILWQKDAQVINARFLLIVSETAQKNPIKTELKVCHFPQLSGRLFYSSDFFSMIWKKAVKQKL